MREIYPHLPVVMITGDTAPDRLVEAQRAGVEYKLEGMDGTSSFQKTSRKEHEIAFSGWGITPPFPDFYQQFHSKEAFLPGTRKPRPMTNNISTFADAKVDPILEANRNARSRQVVKPGWRPKPTETRE